VTKGKINRSASVSVVRNGEVVFEGKLSSLKRFKDDVREVLEGFECGLTVGGFVNLMEGDVIEAYDIEKIARKL
jgi:translation initiation factor IF-2